MSGIKAESGPAEIAPVFKRIFRTGMTYLSDWEHVIDEVKEMNFDAMTAMGIPYESFFSQAIGVPLLAQLAYLPDPPVAFTLNLPCQSSYNLPTMVPDLVGNNDISPTFILFRWMNIVARNVVPNLLRYVYDESLINQRFRDEGVMKDYSRGFFYGFGVEGIRDVAHWPDNSATFNPVTNLNSKFSTKFTDEELPREYADFLDKFDTVVLVAFGTTFMPREAHIMNIVEAIKLSDPSKYGFVISLKEKEAAFS